MKHLRVTDQSTGKSLQFVIAVESVKQSFHRLDQYQATLMIKEPPCPPIWVILQKSMAMVHSTNSHPSDVIKKPNIWMRRFLISEMAESNQAVSAQSGGDTKYTKGLVSGSVSVYVP